MTPVDVRRLAYEVLAQVRRREAFAPRVLDAELRSKDLADSERARLTRLVYGTLQYQGTLDDAVDRFAKGAHKIEPAVRDVMRVAAFELLFSDTSPHAAVHEAVEAVKAMRPRATGMANAVLRRVADESPGFPWADPDSDPDAFARMLGHPRWLSDMWIAQLGRQAAETLMRADNEPAPLYLRNNPFSGPFEATLEALDAEGASPTGCPLPGCIRAGNASRAIRSRTVAGGAAVVTDAAAQFAPVASLSGGGGRLLEIGAGNGTKTISMLSAARESGIEVDLVVLDVHESKLETTLARLDALGLPLPATVVADARTVAESPGPLEPESFDAVLVDAPCSGLGTLRRHPAKRWRISPQDIARLAELQAGLLAGIAPLVRRGGAIVYSTCTISERENDEVVKGFLGSEAGSGFATDSLSGVVPAAWAAWTTPQGWFQSVPSIGGPDGHFVARLVSQ